MSGSSGGPLKSPDFRVLFVCLGNICRSPAAEIILQHLVRDIPLRIEADSAGIQSWHTGSPPDPRMCQALERRGFPVYGKARALREDDFTEFDWVLTMDDSVHAEAIIKCPESLRSRVHRYTEMCLNDCPGGIPDPYYGGADGFEKVLDLLFEGNKTLLEKILAAPNRGV